MFKPMTALSLVLLLVLASPAAAAAAAVPSAPPSTSQQMNIDVGANGQFVYSPANITADVGTLVTFFFPSGIPHSVTQSSFATPCTPLNGANGTGFDSGLQTAKQFTINITDNTVPIWFFCKTPTHCGTGMVGSINAPTSGTNTFDAFQAAAVAIGGNEVTIPDNGFASGGVGAIATASPAATVTGSATGSPSPTSPGSSTGSSTGTTSPTTTPGSGSGSGSDASHAVVATGALGLVAVLTAFGLLA